MHAGLTELLAFLPDHAAFRVATTARRVAVIRLGARQHLCAVIWSHGLALTCGFSLPDQDDYLLLLDSGHTIGKLAWRDPGTGLAAIRLDTHLTSDIQAPPGPVAGADPGALLIMIGADDTASTTACLTSLREPDAMTNSGARPANAAGPRDMLLEVDRQMEPSDVGGPLIAASGALVGVIVGHPNGPGRMVPSATIERILSRDRPGETVRERPPVSPGASRSPGPGVPAWIKEAPQPAWSDRVSAPRPSAPPAPIPQAAAAAMPASVPAGPQGWLGVGLQPVAMPKALRDLAGQSSGRRVIGIIPGGPADKAGLLAGDIVLTLADHNMLGSGAVREFLAANPIGTTAEMAVLRDGALINVNITIGERPPE